jgi:Uma2 family endonuclease
MVGMSVIDASPKLVTAEELQRMGSSVGRCELMFGEIRTMSPAGATHGVVALRFNLFLGTHVLENDLGTSFAAETGFIIERNPDVVRAPDACFIRKDRVRDPLPKGYYPGVPDLLVEVKSPDDTRRELAEKINMWLAHGTAVVWEADPEKMTVRIHRVGQPAVELTAHDTIADEPLLPGFVLPLAKVFKLP